MQRLAARVPRPRLHLIRLGVRITALCEVSGPPLPDHGVLASNAALQALAALRRRAMGRKTAFEMPILPDFGVTPVNHDFADLLPHARAPS